jgi:hypothetical protein
MTLPGYGHHGHTDQNRFRAGAAHRLLLSASPVRCSFLDRLASEGHGFLGEFIDDPAFGGWTAQQILAMATR